MNIILKLIILYFGVAGIPVKCSFWPTITRFLERHDILIGITVECSWWSVIINYLQNLIISDQDTGEIDYEIPCGVSKFNNFETKIVGGTECERNEFPWMASLQIQITGKFLHSCGCTVIHQSFVLTAAHCVAGINPEYLQVVAGIHNVMDINPANSQTRKVKKIYLNNFNSENFKNDIAIAELVVPLLLILDIVVPICIPRGNETFYGEPVVAGWGRIEEDGALPDVCQKVQLNLLNTTVCADNYKAKGFASLLHNCQICTLMKNKDACQGDSGGCLMFHDAKKKTFAGGVISWGVGCARPDNPGVFTETACYASWIIKTVNKRQ